MKIQDPVGSAGTFSRCDRANPLATAGEPLSLFESFPPERVGLNGEYDYHGLANRVRHAFRQRFGEASLQDWAIAQRGSIVTLRGPVTSAYLLYQFIELVLRMEGATGVDVNGTTIFHQIDLNRVTP